MRDTVFISYCHKDKKWLDEFMAHLKVFERDMQMNVWVDTRIQTGARWLDEIETALSSAKVAVLLVTADYLASDFVAGKEIPAILRSQQKDGLDIAWVAVSASAYSATRIAEFQAANNPRKPLNTLPLPRRQEEWAEIAKKVHSLFGNGRSSPAPAAHTARTDTGQSSPSGGVPQDNRYLERPSDAQLRKAVSARESIILVKGARQMGKTSLLGRALRYATSLGFASVYTDFQRLNVPQLGGLDLFYQSLIPWLCRDLDLEIDLEEKWNPKRSGNYNLETILRLIMRQTGKHLVWGLDEVDRLFQLPYSSEFFGLLRAWHNDRALALQSPWENLTIIITYSTEAYAFITDSSQSPFNIGVSIELDDFNTEQISELNKLYGSPLPDVRSVNRFRELLGGQPYLVHRGLSELAGRPGTLDSFFERAPREDGPFGEHLNLLTNLARNHDLVGSVRSLVTGESRLTDEQFWALRRAGIAVGASPRAARLRCQLYRIYLTWWLKH